MAVGVVLCPALNTSPMYRMIEAEKSTVIVYFYVLFCYSHFYFPAFRQAVVTGVVPSLPGLLPSIFSAYGSAISLLVDFSSSVANSRSRTFRESICAQGKYPTNLYKYALGGTRTHETDVYQARG